MLEPQLNFLRAGLPIVVALRSPPYECVTCDALQPMLSRAAVLRVSIVDAKNCRSKVAVDTMHEHTSFQAQAYTQRQRVCARRARTFTHALNMHVNAYARCVWLWMAIFRTQPRMFCAYVRKPAIGHTRTSTTYARNIKNSFLDRSRGGAGRFRVMHSQSIYASTVQTIVSWMNCVLDLVYITHRSHCK